MGKQNTIRRLAAGGMLALACLCGGCAVGGFRQPEQVQPESPAQTENTALNQQYQAEELVYERKLSLPSGGEAAVYRAVLPQFQAEEAPILDKINRHYREELTVLQQDCESYFNQIKTSYGEDWSSAQQPVRDYRVDFTYQIHQAAGQRISLSRTYRYLDINGKEKTVYSAETFDCTTGWLLKLEELFTDPAQAEQQVRQQIQTWMQQNKVENVSVEQFSFQNQDSTFAVSEDTLYLCLDENMVSTESPGGYLAEIPLKNLENLLIQPEEQEK